jgi:multidrug efflux pump subunit AcrA (membrane-fusion protein)
MNSKRWNLFAVIFLFLLACEAEPQDERPVLTPTPVESVLPTITPVHSEITVLAEGVVQAAQPVLSLSFETSGKLITVDIQTGDFVQEGDILAALEEAESLDSYQAAVTSAELSVLIAQQSLDDLYNNAALREAEALQSITSAQEALDTLVVDIPFQQSKALQAIADAQEAVRAAQYQLNSLGALAS